jgi:hypothetical protein
MRDSYLFETNIRCCNALFFAHGKDCVVLDACSGVSDTIGAHDINENDNSASVATPASVSTTLTTSTSSCELTTWHPSINFDHCTNE